MFTANDTLAMLRTALREMAKAGVKVALVNDADGSLVVRISGAHAVKHEGVMRLMMREPVTTPEAAPVGG